MGSIVDTLTLRGYLLVLWPEVDNIQGCNSVACMGACKL